MVGGNRALLSDETRGDERMVVVVVVAAAETASVSRKQFAARGVGDIYLNVLEQDSDSS